jgi:8-oxo-dGTP pyrophosphatase MutT (NUDIX family)
MAPMTTSPRPYIPIDEARANGCREAGALVLLYPVAGEAHTVLTLRSTSLQDHAGQISLPGGGLEVGEDALGAALREAHEEVGIRVDALDILGALTPLFIPPSGFCLSPVVAATPSRPDFRPDGLEVEEVIEVALADLDDAHRRVETWDIRGELRRVPYYALGSYKVWGATAMVLSELAALWQEVISERN